ncbi:hypothetical protein M231_06971 [Tremella mesenterica]|uniref:26S proteasome complex subunit SEM1 n=1 Tax=Tremella mesenterica TaxID=5217 RepID=A0A4Q1BES0_TREME|nr:hypothetical protein M231_06971 [Tremella mesenterica]
MEKQEGKPTNGEIKEVKKKEENEQPHLGVLEEDDEFEEFPPNVIESNQKPKDVIEKLWEDNWDDDDQEDEFCKRLRTAVKDTSAPSAPKPI